MSQNINRFLYAGFTCLGIYFFVFAGDLSQTSINLGIALAFDPFDQNQPWKERPRWQKIWLILHLAFVAAAFGFVIGRGDRV